MRFLKSAVIELIVLIIAEMLIIIPYHISDHATKYDIYRENKTKQTVTVGSAIGMVNDGETVNETVVKKNFYLPESAGKFTLPFFNKKIGLRTANIFYFYPLAGLLAGIICFIMGIGLPLVLYRKFFLHTTSWVDDTFVDYGHILFINGEDMGHPGESISGIIWLILFVIGGTLSLLFGFFLIPIIILNLGIAAVCLTVKGLITLFAYKLNVKGHVDLKENICGPGDKTTYRLSQFCNYFEVANTKLCNDALYFSQYWNAVIAQRIMQCDNEGKVFNKQDAIDTILYGDEKKHNQYEFKRLMHQTPHSEKNKEKNSQIASAKQSRITACMETVDSGDEFKRLGFNNSELGIYINNDINLWIMYKILILDSKKIDFSTDHWSVLTKVQDGERQCEINELLGI